MRYFDQRRKRHGTGPSKGADVPGSGSAGAMPERTVNWPEPGGASSRRNWSLGMRRVKTEMKRKGY